MRRTDTSRSWVVLPPSALSALRVAMAVVFPITSSLWARAVVLLVAALSDLIDGYVARRLGVAGWVGGQLDAITDKILAMSVLITFIVEDVLQPWEVGLLISRDLVVVAIVIYSALTKTWRAFRRMPARLFGKITTAAMFLLFGALVIFPDCHLLVRSTFAVTVLCSVVAAVDYALQFIHAYGQNHRARQIHV